MKKPTCEDCYLVKKRDLKNNYYSLTFENYKRAKDCQPGHFIQIDLPSTDIFFRRPMSVASVTPRENKIEMIFKVVGKGTNLLKHLKKGSPVNILGPLGVPFKLPLKNDNIILIAGGVGFPPLMFLTLNLIEKGYDPRKINFFYGGRSAEDILEKSRIKNTGVKFNPVTEDGSLGDKGLITQPVEKFIKESKGKLRIYSCGPEGMLKAVDELGQKYNLPGQLSLEAPMPCGVGICLGCVVPLVEGGYTRVCCDGPVYEIGEVIL